MVRSSDRGAGDEGWNGVWVLGSGGEVDGESRDVIILDVSVNWLSVEGQEAAR